MFELHLMCAEAQVEWLCEALESLQALSVSVEDADAHTPQERGLFGEPDMPAPAAGWARSTVRALFEVQANAELAKAALLSSDATPPLVDAGIHAVQDQDWVRLTQAQFEPIAITPDFWIVPTWHDMPEQAVTAMRLDPGLAFGTGTHPTTRMCLQWIAGPKFAQALARAQAAGRPLRVLDYGCGSGVLAIAAALHAKRLGGQLAIDAVDLDPAAIQASRDNAALNGVDIRAGDVDAAQGSYDVVLANILATPLKVLAPLLCARMASEHSDLVLAGILERQHEELTAAYAPHVALGVSDTQEGWVCMTASR